MSFGDDYNDFEMLMGCGIGIAMGNSPNEIKHKVNLETFKNDEDGVAVEIEKMLDELE